MRKMDWTWFLIILMAVLCIFLVVVFITHAGNDISSTNYNYYIEICTPDGIIEGPGCIINWYSSGLTLVEIDGIQYKIGSQNVFARKMEDN